MSHLVTPYRVPFLILSNWYCNPERLRVISWSTNRVTPKGTQYTGGWFFFVRDFNKLSYSLCSQGDKIGKERTKHNLIPGCLLLRLMGLELIWSSWHRLKNCRSGGSGLTTRVSKSKMVPPNFSSCKRKELFFKAVSWPLSIHYHS